jgi:hypothetical protein
VQSNTGYFIPNLFCTSLNYTKLFYIYWTYYKPNLFCTEFI